jgi:RND family efflux transporter MFP subunit
MNANPPSEIEEVVERPTQPRKPLRIGRGLFLLVAIAAALAVTGISSRRSDERELARWTLDRAVPTVATVAPERGGALRELVLPGDVDAFYNAVVHAQVSGYVQQWYKDIGARVKAGDVLATIDTPELDQRLAEAREQLTKAKANQALAAVTAERWKSLRQSGAVSQQAADEKVADGQAKDAEVAAAGANLDRLKALKAFANIVAPFDGVVTQRNVDIGSLVNDSANAGSGLFAVADIHEMRVYVKAPQSFAADIREGMKAKLKLPQYPDRSFDATITTTAQAIDQRSRSLLVELSAKNADGALPPGAFAEIHFEIPTSADALRVPASAIIFRDKWIEVATVGADNRIAMKKVEIGRDLGTEVEITSGLSASDRVVASPPDSIEEGDVVRVVSPGAPRPEGGKSGASAPTSDAADPSVVQAAQGRAE